MKRLAAVLVLVAAGLLFTPAVASAQFGLRAGGFPAPVPVIAPSFNPFFYVPQYRYTYGTTWQFNTMMGNFNYSYRQVHWGVNQFANPFNAAALYTMAPAYLQGGSYMTGSAGARGDLLAAQQRAIAQAQRYALSPSAREQISGPANYEKRSTAAIPDAEPQGPPDALRKALVATNPADVASGEALNALLKEIIRVDKGTTVSSAYVPSLLLDDIRFAGSPAADLLNLARQAGNLPFPTAFDDPALAPLRDQLEKDFAAAATPVQAGKAPDGARLTRLEVTFQRVQDAAGPIIKNLPFEEATAARRFLNRMAGALKAMRGNTAVGLIDPKWVAEGVTVADLVKHLNRHKLQFGTAPSGNEEAYMTMHRNLVTYLFVLTQPKK